MTIHTNVDKLPHNQKKTAYAVDERISVVIVMGVELKNRQNEQNSWMFNTAGCKLRKYNTSLGKRNNQVCQFV